MPHPYRLRDPDAVPSPALLFFRDLIARNVAAAVELAGGPHRLRPHVKTHKTPQLVRMQLDAGVTKHKCATPAEAEMLAAVGAPDVLIAYAVVGPNVGRVLELARRYPATAFRVLADDPDAARALSAACLSGGVRLGVLADVNVGMNRTGVPLDRAGELYRSLAGLPGLSPDGLHAYDGHNSAADPAERRRVADGFSGRVLGLRDEVVRAGLPVPRVVFGGTPGFPVHAANADPAVELSPGTHVLYDAVMAERYADLPQFTPAAVLLARVVSRPGPDLVTFDLGHKAVSADQPLAKRAKLLGVPDAEAVSQSEEHLVARTPAASEYRPGDVVYALPGHVCPTVALHDDALVVVDGAVVDRWKIAARGRRLSWE